MIKIFFCAKNAKVSARQKRAVINAVKAAFRREGFLKCACNVIITNNRAIKRLNKKYRNSNRATDCLSFPQYEKARRLRQKGKKGFFLGDIVISAEYAARGAERNGVSLNYELALLACHSALHLLGYDHDAPESEREMFSLQRRIAEAASNCEGGRRAALLKYKFALFAALCYILFCAAKRQSAALPI